LLEQNLIMGLVAKQTRDAIRSMSIEVAVDSSNSAIQRMPLREQAGAVVLAEQQLAGRGRRGRAWYSPFGKNIYLSLGWNFERSMSGFVCLPLVVALAVARCLSHAGLKGHCVKWPNDLMIGPRKLGGCLIEVQGETQGPSLAVAGVGINVDMPASAANAHIDQPWTDVQEQLPGCSRNTLVALLLDALVAHLSQFAEQGFEPFAAEWARWDGLKGKTIDVTGAGDRLSGTMAGIDARGALILETSHGIEHLHSGEVSVRAAGG